MALRGSAAHVNAGVSTSNAVNVTGIPQANDIIILAAQWTGAGATFGLPSGFTTIPGLSNRDCASTTMMALAYKVAAGTETTLTVTSSSNNLSSVVARIYSGRNTVSPFTDVQSTAVAIANSPINPYVLTGVTAAPSDDVVEFVANTYYQGSFPGFTAPPGYANVRIDSNTAVTNIPILVSCDFQGTPAGLTGTNGGKYTAGSLTGLSYTGQQIALAALNPPTVTGVNGAFAMTGQPATMGQGLVMSPGAFAMTGQTALLFVGASGYQLLASPGSFFMIGANAAEGFALEAVPGAFALGGQDVGLAGHLFITGEVGVFALSGSFSSFSIGGIAIPSFRVQAMAAGFYNGDWKDIGDVFDVDSSQFSDSTVSFVPAGNPAYPVYGWMLQVPATTPLFSYAASGLSTPRNSPRRTVV